ncbi:MAG: aminopeptidase N [SAR86 cluster bacterium]|uniref:Aminopeptidase N n=1 Tax=SAR86 cluster bacterium TaxID=2030880 RepID=A0A2A5B273_9GAMM|nr:MAG: aminopeptidase N [SAR86 cluster bacterium]
MRLLPTLVLFCSVILLSACSEQAQRAENIQDTSEVPGIRPALDQLSQAEAIARKARVSEISYLLDIDLVSAADAYQGRVTLQFDLTDNDTTLDVDFTGGSVLAVIANGETLEPEYNGYFITLPESALKVGGNEIVIDYQHPYDQDGTGLHRFVDPEDGLTYLYTYLWPYYSNRLFPNFDQPNLKATYELTVRAASDWQVVSSTTEDSITVDGDSRLWHFPRSEKFSSYIFSLHAGPYQIWEDMAGDVPIRLMARQSLSEYVAVDEWLAYTKAGLAHYAEYFEIPYPFVKYDQIIVPDFLIGAMENVAAVTFSESYVDRGASNRFNSQRRAGTILHEMAHMWFGDLVTMNWWNGLWLNESFATLMSSIAVSQATEFEDLWHDFYLSENLSAISADNAVSTHPIEVSVASTNDFFNVFDAITYDKGASVLNQLSHYIGRENFRLGVSSYLTQYSWENTELADFMDSLSEQSGIDLNLWAQDWMYQAGVNTIEARFSCDANGISRFAILQTAPDEFPTLREQRVQLGLFSLGDAGGIEPIAVIPVEIVGAETQVSDVVGLPCPDLAIPNYEGWGYTELSLDDVSMDTIIEGDALGRINDPLLRSMIWTALFDAPDNGQMENNTLLETLIESLSRESNDRIIRQTLAELVSNLNKLERLGANYSAELASNSSKAEQQLWQIISAGVYLDAEGSRQSESTLNLRLSNYIRIARSDVALTNLAGLLDGSVQIEGLNLGQNTRWNIIRRFSSRNYISARELLAAERERDSSDAGRRAAIAAEAALPDLAIKQDWVNRILDTDNPLPLSNLRAAMGSIFPTGQEDLQLALLPQLAENLTELAVSRDNYFQQSYGRDLFSGICSEQGLQLVSAAISDRELIGATLYRFISENEQKAADCVSMKR